MVQLEQFNLQAFVKAAIRNPCQSSPILNHPCSFLVYYNFFVVLDIFILFSI